MSNKLANLADEWESQTKSLERSLCSPGFYSGDGSEGVEANALRECASELRKALNAGHWTTQPPTEPGWYWFAPYEGPVDVVEVFKARNGNELLATDNMATYSLKEMDGTWYSEPLSVPPPNSNGGTNA